mmetsp:Transcript_16903/g.41533  ORF Transcript_16903/g.41533 Transcript_16903/m.41533 type:complete len:159 (-) Transcript_16903:120-596(-)
MPNYITLTLKAWKHNADGKLTQQLLIKRNMMHPAYCPVFTLVATVEISSRYPLFSAVESYRANLSKVFQYVGGSLRYCTSHSIRHNVVKWAARCGAQQADIMRGGRWVETSAKFLGYWKQEILKTKQMLGMTKQKDIIFTFWVWETTAYEAVGSSRGM